MHFKLGCTHSDIVHLAVDDTVSHMFYLFSETTVTMIAKLIAVCLMTPIFLLMGAIVFMMGGFLGQMYIKAQLSVKRESSNAKAPVLGQCVHFFECGYSPC